MRERKRGRERERETSEMIMILARADFNLILKKKNNLILQMPIDVI